jgi:hypothetical protein
MASQFEKEFSLLEKWRRASSRLHFLFKNSHDGWSVEGTGSIHELSKTDESLLIEFKFEGLGFVNFSLELDKCSFRSFDPRIVPEGMSFPLHTEGEITPYISENFLTIIVSEKSFLMLADLVDETSFSVA